MDAVMTMVMGNWHVLNKSLNTFSEEQVKDMLEYEMLTKRRPVIAKRLFVRYNRMRGDRELGELMGRMV